MTNLVATAVGEDRVVEAGEQLHVLGASGADVADRVGVRRVEHGGETGHSLDDLLVHDVRLVETGLRMRVDTVVDLDDQRRPRACTPPGPRRARPSTGGAPRGPWWSGRRSSSGQPWSWARGSSSARLWSPAPSWPARWCPTVRRPDPPPSPRAARRLAAVALFGRPVRRTTTPRRSWRTRAKGCSKRGRP